MFKTILCFYTYNLTRLASRFLFFFVYEWAWHKYSTEPQPDQNKSIWKTFRCVVSLVSWATGMTFSVDNWAVKCAVWQWTVVVVEHRISDKGWPRSNDRFPLSEDSYDVQNLIMARCLCSMNRFRDRKREP